MAFFEQEESEKLILPACRLGKTAHQIHRNLACFYLDLRKWFDLCRSTQPSRFALLLDPVCRLAAMATLPCSFLPIGTPHQTKPERNTQSNFANPFHSII